MCLSRQILLSRQFGLGACAEASRHTWSTELYMATATNWMTGGAWTPDLHQVQTLLSCAGHGVGTWGSLHFDPVSVHDRGALLSCRGCAACLTSL